MIFQADSVVRLDRCRLEVVPGTAWPFAAGHAAEIEAHWQRRRAESPAMFNGPIHLMHGSSERAGTIHGSFLRTDFKSYLYWREQGFPDAGVLDGFGSALIRTAEDHVVLGRQRAGNVNAGLAYLPGGFIDPRDVGADGRIDIDGSILRELQEETGLAAADVEMRPGYLLTICGPLRSFAREIVVPLPAEAVRARILAHIAGDAASELVDAVIVRTAADLEGGSVAPYARQLLGWLLAQDR